MYTQSCPFGPSGIQRLWVSLYNCGRQHQSEVIFRQEPDHDLEHLAELSVTYDYEKEPWEVWRCDRGSELYSSGEGIKAPKLELMIKVKSSL